MANKFLKAVTEQPEPDPFSVFDSVPQVLAFLHKQEGQEATETVLRTLVDPRQPRPYSREQIEAVAEELSALGFSALATLIETVAQDAIPKDKLPLPCPHDPDDGVHFTHWWRSQGLKVPRWSTQWSQDQTSKLLSKYMPASDPD